MIRTAPVVVVRYGYDEDVFDKATSYTVRADGVLEVRISDGSLFTFGEFEWVDVRMLASNDNPE